MHPLYIAFRFDLKGGVAATVAVFHDVLVSLGALSLADREFSLPVLAGLLTIIGYSVNDTIVAYDRLRENWASSPQGPDVRAADEHGDQPDALADGAHRADRVLLDAMMLFFGGKVLEDMAFTLFVGVITGTYSTIYIAGALVVDWTNYVEGRLRRGKKAVAKA